MKSTFKFCNCVCFKSIKVQTKTKLSITEGVDVNHALRLGFCL